MFIPSQSYSPPRLFCAQLEGIRTRTLPLPHALCTPAVFCGLTNCPREAIKQCSLLTKATHCTNILASPNVSTLCSVTKIDC